MKSKNESYFLKKKKKNLTKTIMERPRFSRRAFTFRFTVVCCAKRLIVFTLESYIRHHFVERRKAVNDYKRCSKNG